MSALKLGQGNSAQLPSPGAVRTCLQLFLRGACGQQLHELVDDGPPTLIRQGHVELLEPDAATSG